MPPPDAAEIFRGEPASAKAERVKVEKLIVAKPVLFAAKVCPAAAPRVERFSVVLIGAPTKFATTEQFDVIALEV